MRISRRSTGVVTLFLMTTWVFSLPACQLVEKKSGSEAKDLIYDSQFPDYACATGAKKSLVLVADEGIHHPKQLPAMPIKLQDSYGFISPSSMQAVILDLCVEDAGTTMKAELARIRFQGESEKSWTTKPSAGGKAAGLVELLKGDASQLDIDWPNIKTVFRDNGQDQFSSPSQGHTRIRGLNKSLAMSYQGMPISAGKERVSGFVMVGTFIEGDFDKVPKLGASTPPAAWTCESGTSLVTASLYPPTGAQIPANPVDNIFYSAEQRSIYRFDVCLDPADAIKSGRLVERLFLPDILTGNNILKYNVFDLKDAISTKGLSEALFGDLDNLRVEIPIPFQGLNKPNALQLSSKEFGGTKFVTVMTGTLDVNGAFDRASVDAALVGELKPGDAIADADLSCPQGGYYSKVDVKVGTFSLTGDACALPSQFQVFYSYPKLTFRDQSSHLRGDQQGPVTWTKADLDNGGIFIHNYTHHNASDSWTLHVPGADYLLATRTDGTAGFIFDVKYADGTTDHVEINDQAPRCTLLQCDRP